MQQLDFDSAVVSTKTHLLGHVTLGTGTSVPRHNRHVRW